MSKAWIILTASDLDDYLVGAQVTAMRTAALSAGQDDPVAQAIVDISAEIRNNIRACSSNVLSLTAGSIPPELRRHACALVIEASQPRLKIKLTDEQKTAAENARKLMIRIARCDYPVTAPTDPDSTPDDQGGSAKPSIAQKQTHRTNQDGI